MTLRLDVVRVLREGREAAGLSLADLATRAGLSVSVLSRVERGTLAPSLDNLDKIFTALGLRLRLSTEPLDDPEAQLERLSVLPLNMRLEKSGVAQLLRTLDSLPYVIDGALAATLQGIPLPVEALDLAVAWRDSDAFTGWLIRRLAYRWNESRQEFRLLDLDPRAPGAHLWQTAIGKVRARMVEELPTGIEIMVGEASYRVRPLAEIESDDEQTARLLRRYRQVAG